MLLFNRFIDSFSRSLYYEYCDKGVIVQCHHPFYIPTKLSKIKLSSIFCPSADLYAYSSLRKLGEGGPVIIPYWSHSLQYFFYTRLPNSLLIFVYIIMLLLYINSFLEKSTEVLEKEH